MTISMLDEVGSEAGRTTTVADPAGNWIAHMPEVILQDIGYTIQVVQTPATWGDSPEQPHEPLERFFVGAKLVPQMAIENPVEGRILGGVMRGKSALEMVEELTKEEDY